MGSYCYFKQGTRDHSGRGMLWQAQMFIPQRPEAHFLLARYAEKISGGKIVIHHALLLYKYVIFP